MALITQPPPLRTKGAVVPPTVTLALWRLRRTGGLLLITGVGIIAAVMLVCTVPIYAQTAQTAGLRGALAASPQNALITIRSVAQQINIGLNDTATQELNQEFKKDLGPYLDTSQPFIQMEPIPLITNPVVGNSQQTYKVTKTKVQISGTDMNAARQHVQLVRGRLPQNDPIANDQYLEVAISVDTASTFHITIGSEFNADVIFGFPPIEHDFILPIHIVGLFKLPTANDQFWHGHDFLPPQESVDSISSGPTYPLLASDKAFTSLLSNFSNNPNLLPGLTLASVVELFWYYHFDASHMAITDLDAITAGIRTAKTNIANNFDLNREPFLANTAPFPFGDFLDQYHNRAMIAQIPIFSLLLLMLGLLLFFVSMMADLLVDRQTDAIAILRSRGASRRQIFGSLLTQSLGLVLIALIVGPMLALLLTGFLVQTVLASSDQSVLKLIFDHFLEVIWSLRWYALITAGVAVISMAASINRATHLDVLAIRRETARTTRLPFWQRFHVDIIAAIIALVGYGISVYLTNSNVLDVQRRLILLTPLTLLGLVCLLLAALLLFLRVFPVLLRWGALGASYSRGAAPLLALAQMARAPRQSVRMTLLLALSTSFAIFTLIFTATQAQHVLDVSAYQVGADFQGTLLSSSITRQQVESETAAYRRISGVESSTVGYTSPITTASRVTLNLQAVDANTFASTAIWSAENSSQSLPSLMAQLRDQRSSALSNHIVPAILDATAWVSLGLSPGAVFTITFSDGPVQFVALTDVAHIPPIARGAILVDYPSFANVYTNLFKLTGGDIPINTVWLQTKDDATTLANVRSALNDPNLPRLQLQIMNDRRQLITLLQQEPLYLGLIGVLLLGATTALLLALLGNLLISWLTARSRLTNFAVLRALGAASRHIASVLTWEQSLVYTTAIALGILLGTLLSSVVVPVLVFTGVAPSGNTSSPSDTQFFLSQSVPPIQTIVPPSLIIALGVLVAICLIALGMMVRIVSRPSISQTLRLSED